MPWGRVQEVALGQSVLRNPSAWPVSSPGQMWFPVGDLNVANPAVTRKAPGRGHGRIGPLFSGPGGCPMSPGCLLVWKQPEDCTTAIGQYRHEKDIALGYSSRNDVNVWLKCSGQAGKCQSQQKLGVFLRLFQEMLLMQRPKTPSKSCPSCFISFSLTMFFFVSNQNLFLLPWV